MKANIESFVINYSGEVKLKIFKEDKYFKTISIHNSGTDDFFKFLRDCCAGISGTNSRIPFYLKYCDYSGTTIPSTAWLGGVGFSATQNKNANSIIYTFLLSSSTLPVSTVSNEVTFNHLGLFSADNKLYAQIDLDNSVSLDTSGSTNIYVEWTLSFESPSSSAS